MSSCSLPLWREPVRVRRGELGLYTHQLWRPKLAAAAVARRASNESNAEVCKPLGVTLRHGAHVGSLKDPWNVSRSGSLPPASSGLRGEVTLKEKRNAVEACD